LAVETILVVDSRAGRRTLRDLLIAAGYQVDFAPANAALSSILVSDRPAVVLLTWHQGKAIPQAACMTIRRASLDVPLIVLGPKTETTAKVRLFELGADDYVEEPFDDVELIVRVRSAIRRAKLCAERVHG
jgi:two-component system OmpR family response regulator